MMTMALVLVTATFANAQEIPTPTHTVYCLGCRGTQTTRNYPTPLRSLLFGGTQTQVNYAPVTQQPPPL